MESVINNENGLDSRRRRRRSSFGNGYNSNVQKTGERSLVETSNNNVRHVPPLILVKNEDEKEAVLPSLRDERRQLPSLPRDETSKNKRSERRSSLARGSSVSKKHQSIRDDGNSNSRIVQRRSSVVKNNGELSLREVNQTEEGGDGRIKNRRRRQSSVEGDSSAIKSEGNGNNLPRVLEGERGDDPPTILDEERKDKSKNIRRRRRSSAAGGNSKRRNTVAHTLPFVQENEITQFQDERKESIVGRRSSVNIFNKNDKPNDPSFLPSLQDEMSTINDDLKNHRRRRKSFIKENTNKNKPSSISQKSSESIDLPILQSKWEDGQEFDTSLSERSKKENTVNNKQQFLKKVKKLVSHEEIILPSDSPARKAAEALGLTQRHLRRLRYKFDSIDIDGSGSIDYEEFFELMNEKRSPITDSLFALIDTDGSGVIEFEEFVHVCATFCVYSKEDILSFCFDCFDKDRSGSIDDEEFKELANTIHNTNPTFPGNFAQALAEFDTNSDGLIDFKEFVELDRRFPMIVFPAFRLQDRIQKMTLGEREWTRINEKIAAAMKVKDYMDRHGGRRPTGKPFFRFFDDMKRKVGLERNEIPIETVGSLKRTLPPSINTGPGVPGSIVIR